MQNFQSENRIGSAEKYESFRRNKIVGKGWALSRGIGKTKKL